jgi:hypothetical protein
MSPFARLRYKTLNVMSPFGRLVGYGNPAIRSLLQAKRTFATSAQPSRTTDLGQDPPISALPLGDEFCIGNCYI